MKRKVLVMLMDVASPTQATISRAFNPADFDVMWAANVPEAMEISTRHHVDLLLLDLSQQLRTGWKTFERLRTLNAGVPIILLTEHEPAYEEAATNQPGAVLRKPFSVAVLTHAVNSLLAMPSPGGALPVKQDPGSPGVTTGSEDFREMLYRRYTAPFKPASPYRQWGINE